MTTRNRYRVVQKGGKAAWAKVNPNPVYEAAARLAGVTWPNAGQALVIHPDEHGMHITLIEVERHSVDIEHSTSKLCIEGFVVGDGYE